MDEEGRLYLEAANKGLKEWKRRTMYAEATAFRRLEMLRELEDLRVIESAMCPFCGFYEHGPYCELAKELGSDV